MKTSPGRRSFLSLCSRGLAGSTFLRLLNPSDHATASQPIYHGAGANTSCWLDVCAPFVLQDPQIGIESEILLTSDNFVGAKGYSEGIDATEYEIYIYDSEGQPFGEGGVARRLTIPAMQTTLISVSEIVGPKTSFWGGMRIRLRAKTRSATHASDLFSSAFVRWKTKDSFTNVHANPDPLEWQRADSFFYSMPFPPLQDYECVYSLFNPYAHRSIGALTLYDPLGVKLKVLSYDLKPHSSVLVDLRKGEYTRNIQSTFNPTEGISERNHMMRGGANGGTIAVTNLQGSVKNFGYLLIKQANTPRFSIEHPIHQPPYNPLPARLPFDSAGGFKAQNVLYTPLVFRSRKIGGITLDSRFHLSSGAPMEEALWMSPLITDANGNVVWQTGGGSKLPSSISERQIERDAIRLGGQQSCILDCSKMDLPEGFSGGLSLAITPLSNHTLMKVEVRAVEWNATAFTHFRPGLAAARAYQKPAPRAGLATDYVVSGAWLEFRNGKILRDEVIAIINIDDKDIAGQPTLEVFDSRGFVARIKLEKIPGFSCRHYLLSELLSEKIRANDLSLRLVDENTTLLMSVLHLDFGRRDIAADHGSDRFSTFSEFTCDSKA
ncbi:MAG TPA: hypothetical protein VGQ41_18860 [Pyrinomonadaceae bacterium]|jgi:hypothetical protein|nr:hypothetical protein [Pyrinomonadaceae bacterium]